MNSSFVINGIDAASLSHLFKKTDEELVALGARRMVCDEAQSFPCRVTLQEAVVGERVILAAFEHQPAQSPYQSSGPIFIREGFTAAARFVDELPPVLCNPQRLLSLRAYDREDLIVDADVCSSAEVRAMIRRIFAREDVAYLHVHNAKRGCYSCRVDRV